MQDNQKPAQKNGGYRRHRGHKPHNNNHSDAYVAPYAADLLAKSLSSVGIGDATLQALERAHITTVGDVCRRRMQDMYRVQNFGKRNLQELSNAMRALGVAFRPDEAEPKEDKAPAVQSKPQDKGQDRAQQPKNEQRPNKQKGQNLAPQPNKNPNKSKQAFEEITLADVFPKPKFVKGKRIEMETDRFVKFQHGGKWGFKDKNGKEVIPPIYDEVFNFKDDMACVERKQLFGYINRDNELVVPYRYECASSFSEGYACVGNDSKCGFINKQGDVVVPFIYDACTAVVDGHSHIKQDGKWGTLDLATNEIIWS